MRGRTIGLVSLAAWAIAACGDGAHSNQENPGPGASIVQLGDSVAAGEGIYYDLHYDDRFIFPTWSAPGNRHPTWDPPYPLCHDANLAYGNVVASALGGRFTKFACTGAAYDNGIAVPEVSGGQTLGPAQFGVWQTMTDLNAAYDTARPDVVLITQGADDVEFVTIIEYCFLASFVRFQDLGDTVLSADEPREAIRDALAELVGMLIDEIENGDVPELVPDSERFCTAANPGSVITSLFWDRLPQIEQNYAALVQGITERGQHAGKVPQIVFTTYHDPLPPPGADISFLACPDAMHLTRAQIDYIESLLETLSGEILAIQGAQVVDIRTVLDGHRWCSHAPWAYGPSALLFDFESQAPFHPTVDGQAAIAALVQPVVRTD